MSMKAFYYHGLLLLFLVATSGCGSQSQDSELHAQAEPQSYQTDSPQEELVSRPTISPDSKSVDDHPQEIVQVPKQTQEASQEKVLAEVPSPSEPEKPAVTNSSSESATAESVTKTVIPVVAEKSVEAVKEPPVIEGSNQPKVTRAPVRAPKVQEEELPLKREIKLLVEPPLFRKTGKGEQRAIRVSFDDLDLLRILNMEPVSINAVDYFPPWLKELEGKKIRLRGFMYPTYQETGIKGFLLARDNEICCFGRDPKEYDIIQVKMKEGTDTDYIPNRPFDVIATFHIRPKKWDEEKLLRLYALDDAVIINK